MRIAVIDKEKCRPEKCDFLCRRMCPRVRAGDDDTIVMGEDNKPVISEVLCVGCGICVKKCPFDAIKIINLPEELECPVHQYGQNGFRLFRLPIPSEAKVGLLGENGIGKTTVLDILSGTLVPNFGGEVSTREEVIGRYAGTELQDHFLKMEKGMKVSVKPQQITKLPDIWKGTVRGLLEKAASRDFRGVVSSLSLEPVLDRKLENLSGGELQRVAIATAMVKRADFFFFDEPASYLDISQRLKAAHLIKSIEGPTLVVEHDLVVLDFLTDVVHIMYGVPGAYGITSISKSTRSGINAYLDGYIREENMRFRSALHFTEKSHSDFTGKTLVDFSSLSTQLGDFTLDISPGSLAEGEVVGVVGPNGIGKTTFVKMLAGIVDYEGEVEKQLKVAYKPQYLEAEKGTVDDVLAECRKRAADVDFDGEIGRPLALDRLRGKEVTQLSGGELQALSVATTLSHQADLYLFDEPAAYLDVEQRIAVADLVRRLTLKRGATALVVDHDIMFIDYLSDRLMVFGGEPSIHGKAEGPMKMRDGMNSFLRDLDITFRRDPDTKRPRANKPGSQMDRQQRSSGEFYYT